MKQISLTQGRVTLIDDEDFDYLNQWKWQYSNRGYAIRTDEGVNYKKTILMHRVIMYCPANKQVDHRDLNKLNNQKYNLRICTNSQNRMNQSIPSTNRSGYKGVSIQGNRFQANIKIKGKCIYLGLYYNPIFAAMVYDIKAKELFGEFARLNFPQE